jgi:hypothetical protein
MVIVITDHISYEKRSQRWCCNFEPARRNECRGSRSSLCFGRNLGCFRNDQAGAGALSVVEGVRCLLRVPFPSLAPRERRHENTVLSAQAPSSSGLKRIAIIVRKELHLAWRQRHRPSINQKVHTRFQLLSEFLFRFFPVEDKGSL